MSLPTSSTPYDTHKCIGARIEYPFRDMGDSVTKIYHHSMMGNLLSYTPLTDDDIMTLAGDKPSGSPFPDDSAAYYIGDSEPENSDGGTVKYERMFANVPASRIDPNGLYPFTFPGNTSTFNTSLGDSTGGYSHTITSTSGENLTIEISFTMSTADAADVYAGSLVRLENNGDVFELDAGAGTFTRSFLDNFTNTSCTVTNVAGTTITVTYVDDAIVSGTQSFDRNPNLTFIDYTLRVNPLPVRDPIQDSTTSTENVTYEKASSSSDLTSFAKKFKVVNSSGVQVDTLTTTTSPTEFEYTILINTGAYINAEDESFERWRGNIYERKTIRVRPK